MAKLLIACLKEYHITTYNNSELEISLKENLLVTKNSPRIIRGVIPGKIVHS